MERWEVDEELEDDFGVASESEWPRSGGRRSALKVAALFLVVMLAGVAAAVALFSHNFATFTPSAGGLSTSCTTTTVQSNEIGGVGSAVWGCGTSQALTVGSAVTVSYTHNAPIGTGADQYTSLYVVQGPKPATVDDCQVTGGWAASKPITPASGTVVFAPGDVGNWWYCAEYTGLGAKNLFSVSWSQ